MTHGHNGGGCVQSFRTLSHPTQSLASFALSFAISLALTALLIRIAPWLGLVDQPSERKFHTRTTPRGGGLAIYAAVIASTYALRFTIPDRGYFVLLAVGFFVVLLGLLDDLRPLPWYVRLEIQFVAAAILVYYTSGSSSLLFRVCAVLWIVTLTNAFNMLDNMDGLSGGVAFVAAIIMGVSGLFREQPELDWYSMAPFLILAGAIAGFLVFNRPPARIFMGDAGSTFLGFCLGSLIISRSFVIHSRPETWVVPFCIMAVPCYDLMSVVVLRLRQGRSPFHADKQHLSHRLVGLGLSAPLAVTVIVLLGLASGISGLLIYQVSRKWALLIAVQMFALWLAVALLEYLRHLRAPH
jgi:UDP-GlcNAc:undecaprenyl-phosphate GlcNAc-1-phosphate transferase